VSAERTAGGGGEFKIHLCAGLERAEGGAVEGFLSEICVEECRIDIEGSEANAGDGEGVALAKAAGKAGGIDRDATDAAAVGERDEGAGLLDDAGEHLLILGNKGTREQGNGKAGNKGTRERGNEKAGN
jgi:hypothetical protein